MSLTSCFDTFFLNFKSPYQQCKYIMHQYCKHDAYSAKAVINRFSDFNFNQQADLLEAADNIQWCLKDKIFELDTEIKNKPFTDCNDPKKDKRVAEAKHLIDSLQKTEKLFYKLTDIHEETKLKTKQQNLEDLKSIQKFEALTELVMAGIDVTVAKSQKGDANNTQQSSEPEQEANTSPAMRL